MNTVQSGPDTDSSNGWNAIAPAFIEHRQHSRIGVAALLAWARDLPPGGEVLDLGCGFGVPLAEALINQGFNVYGIDASPSLVEEFRRRLPGTPVSCEAIENSAVHNKTFDGVIAIGLLFLLPAESQLKLIGKVARVLKKNGRFLFTAPHQVCSWKDLLTARESVSLGRAAYLDALGANDLRLLAEFADDGENHYFAAVRK